MKKVMVFGSFDILHPGHIYFLNEAKSYGDYLIVIVARDTTIKKVKDREPKYNQSERLENIKELTFVDKALLGKEDDKYKIIKDEAPDFICLGYDQDSFTQNLEDEIKKKGLKTKIIRLRPYREDIYKSSKMK